MKTDVQFFAVHSKPWDEDNFDLRNDINYNWSLLHINFDLSPFSCFDLHSDMLLPLSPSAVHAAGLRSQGAVG